jgi:ADP-heptose:LPS heptosyltransferase
MLINTPVTTALPARARQIFVWHQGALGDILVAGPALQALANQYPEARFTLVGGEAQLSLLSPTLPVAAVWSSQRAVWLELFHQAETISPALGELLRPFDLAVVFSPTPSPDFLARLVQTGLPAVVWLPSFPPPGQRQSGRALQAAHLQALGLPKPPPSWQLIIPEAELAAACCDLAAQSAGSGPWLAVAPGSGHSKKNWPLEYYIALAALLEERWQADIWWLLGPAEAALTEQLASSIAANRRQHMVAGLPLPRVAACLANCHLYIGNDSGLTHLAAAVAGPWVLAIFGPSDPLVWAPPEATVVASPLPCAPCSHGRTISCPEPRCLADLPLDTVLAAVETLLRVSPPGH